MAIDHNSEDGRLIRKRIPLNTLPGPLFETLCKYLTVEQQPAGYQLFERDDVAEDLFYLIEGNVTLKSHGFKIETISAESEFANFAIAHQNPRKIGAIANTPISFLRIPPSAIKKLQASSANIDEHDIIVEHDSDDEKTGDWMTRLIKSPIFQLVPAANLQKTLISLKEIQVKAGECVVKQDEYPGDFYYIIKTGECSLSRKPSKNAKDITLGTLTAGDSFGEASILADKPRELTITALTDSTLLKLDKEHFITLIRNPSLTFINPTTISQELKNGSLLIDIRSPDDFQENHIDGSINMPYFSIRMTIKNLDRSRKIMILCGDGKLSEAAAFNLIREQFNVAIVEGGLEKYQHTDKHKTNFEIDDPALDDDTTSEQDLPEQQIQTNVIEMPGVFETNTSPANKQNPEPEFDNSTLIEAKIQLLKDENRALMRANMRLEIQYEELLKQKEMLELQLHKIQNKQG